MLKTISKVRVATRMLAAVAAAAVLTLSFGVQPAQAATISRAVTTVGVADAAVYNDRSDVSSQAWVADRSYYDIITIEDKGTWSGRPQVKFVTNGRCLDTRGGTSGAAIWWMACNTGDYQLWQVFKTGSVYTYKSKAAYTKQDGLNLCMRALSKNAAIHLYGCSTGSRQQQFKLVNP